MISEPLREELTRQHYRLAGTHSAVKLCHWTKQSLINNRYCYKQKFYGIQSHRCLQMTPAVAWCNQRCLYCWRTHKLVTPNIKWDDPESVIEESIAAQRVLLTGYYGLLDRVDIKKLEEAMNPNQVAISLAGEPTLYPYLSGLIEGFTKRGFTTFLVTNGLLPNVLAELTLPTQLYISLSAPNEKIHKRLNVPLIANSWNFLNETLELLPSLNTRKVIRITLVKGWNDVHPEMYAKLIEKASPNFVEIKAYMFVGDSRRRMTINNMPRHDEVVKFTKLIENELPDYKLINEKEDSRVTLLSNGKIEPKIRITQRTSMGKNENR